MVDTYSSVKQREYVQHAHNLTVEKDLSPISEAPVTTLHCKLMACTDQMAVANGTMASCRTIPAQRQRELFHHALSRTNATSRWVRLFILEMESIFAELFRRVLSSSFVTGEPTSG